MTPCSGVSLSPGQDIQAAIDTNPPGTTLCLAAGTYRLQQVVPKDDDRFIGQPGAIMSGAKVLDPNEFVREGGVYSIGGQTQEGWSLTDLSVILPGYERDNYNEMLFVNGSTVLTHVGSLGELGPGTSFFDYDSDHIYMHDDPHSFSIIETSVTPSAFGGSGVRNVLIENLVIEKYANSFQTGAVGSLSGPQDRYQYDWKMRYLPVRHNHGGGINTGPGGIIENCKIYENGQFGIDGTASMSGRPTPTRTSWWPATRRSSARRP
jgi:hypothetical protein